MLRKAKKISTGVTIIFAFVFSELSSFGQKNQVCFSFDDLPVVNYGITDSTFQKELLNHLILSLKARNIPAIGFVNERKLHDEKGIIQFQVGILNNWVNNGLELGNHTYSHPDYNEVSLEDFSADILRGESLINGILKRKGGSIKYFRHPFLHTGNTKAKADSLENFLKDHGYRVAPVTIDNDDYLFALAYHRAKRNNDSDLVLKIGHDYLTYMEKKLKYYEKEAYSLFGRNISQILLIHASLLNSDYTDSLAIMFQRNNYSFVSIDKALEDDVYKNKIKVFGNYGISWIDRWALSQGKRGEFFRSEPVTPDYIIKLSK